MGPNVEALAIYQDVIDVISDALMAGDCKTVADYLTQPFHMRTVNGWFPLNTFEDVEHSVTSMHFSLRIQGVTDYIRNASQAQFRDANTIEGVHTTNILVGERPLVTPYESRMILVKDSNNWRVSLAEHSMENAKWPVTVPEVSGGTLADLDETMQNDAEALEIYQTFINQLTQANIKGDHDAWNALCEFPHRVQIDHAKQIISSATGTAAFLNTMSDILQKAKDKDYKRTATFAGYLGPNIIRGYHITTLGGADSATFRPIQSRITIRRTKDQWRVIELVNSIANTKFPYENPIVSNNLISEFHNPRKA